MSPKELLEQLNALDEHTRIEAKTASELGKSVLETVCAFANEPGLGGGWVLLGARADEDAQFRQYEAVGLPDPDKASRELASQCNTAFNRPVRVEIESGVVNGKHLLAVFVPEAEAATKPVFIQSRPLPASAMRRIGSSNMHCTEDDLVVFYQDRRGEAFDATIIRDADMTAFDSAAIADYRRLRADANSDAEELRWTDAELLHALRCTAREAGVERPTVAGILLFGTAQSLRRWFPMMRVDYIRVPGREWVQNPDRRFDTVELRAPLITLIRRARAAVLDDLPKAFSLQPGQLHRQDIAVIPDRVIREAVVNAVMHRSYRLHGAVQVIRYANRLEIRNPGHSLIAEERLGEPGSQTRNPAIAAVLHDTNLAETKGSGIRVMRELMAATGLTPPTFESDRERDQFVVTLLFHHFLTPEDWTWLRQFQDSELSDEDARALVFVREIGAITNADYRSLNSRTDVLHASQHLRRLRDRGLLEQKGKGSSTYYKPTDRLMQPWQEILAERTAGTDTTSEHGELTPKHGEPTPKHGEPTPKHGEPTPKHGELTPKQPGFPADLPTDLSDALIKLRLKTPRPELEDLVVRLCRWQALSRDELSKLISRHPVYVRDKLLPPLLRAGRLARTIPTQPFHPQQKYRAVGD
jgi:ATP-dependent DNA helicase RecG